MSLWNESFWTSLFMAMALKGTAVLAVSWLASILLRGRSAAARHLVWTAASAALVALPFLSISLPAVRIPLAQAILPAAAVFQTSAAPVGERTSRALPRVRPSAPVKSGVSRADWRLPVALLWAAGAIAVFAQLMLGWVALWRARRSARPFSAPEFSYAITALGVRHSVDLLQGSRGSMPMTFGLLRPSVFLPNDAEEWTADRRRVVLLHELAHVKRGDIATQLLARIALGLNWWNPLAWIAWREFLKERERAADDLVLSTGAHASVYADHLLAIARTMQFPWLAGAAATAMARRSQLESRLTALLDSGVNRKRAGRGFTLLVALWAAAMVVPIAAVRAQDAAAQTVPTDLDAAIRAASAQKNPEMLDSAAKTAVSARKYDIARRLLDASLAIRSNVSGEQSREYGIGLLNLAELESKRGKSGEPRMFYEKAVTVLGDQPAAARALIGLGVYAMATNNLDQAIEYFEHARAVNPKNAGLAIMWAAVARQQQGKADEAESLYKAALGIQDANSSEAATAMELYAAFLRQQGREDEARSMQERSITLRKALAAQARSATGRVSPNAYIMGPGVTSPKLLSKVEPEYTDEARAAKYQGTAVLSVEVGTDGLAHNIQIARGLGLGLNDKAIEAISQWKFQPGSKDGQAVAVIANIEINWRLL